MKCVQQRLALGNIFFALTLMRVGFAFLGHKTARAMDKFDCEKFDSKLPAKTPMSQQIDVALLKNEKDSTHSLRVIDVALRESPDAAVKHLLDFADDASMPIRARVKALKGVLAVVKPGKNFQSATMEQVKSVAIRNVDRFLQVTRYEISGTVPPGFNDETSLDKSDIPARYSGLVDKMATDAELFATPALTALADLDVGRYRSVLKGMGKLYDDAEWNPDQSSESLVHGKNKIESMVRRLAMNCPDVQTAALTLQALDIPAHSLTLPLKYLDMSYDKMTAPDGTENEVLHRTLQSLVSRSSSYIQQYYSGVKDFVWRYNTAAQVAKMRSYLGVIEARLGRKEGASEILAQDISTIVASSTNRLLPARDLYSLLTDINDVNYRSADPVGLEALSKSPALILSYQRTLKKLISDLKKFPAEKIAAYMEDTHLELSPIRVLTEALQVMENRPTIWVEVKKDRELENLLKEIAGDQQPEINSSVKIFGRMNVYKVQGLLHRYGP